MYAFEICCLILETTNRLDTVGKIKYEDFRGLVSFVIRGSRKFGDPWIMYQRITKHAFWSRNIENDQKRRITKKIAKKNFKDHQTNMYVFLVIQFIT